MTSQELKSKLEASNEQVSKRLGTMEKLCKKLNVNFEELKNEFSLIDPEFKMSYLPSRIAKEIVAKFVERKPDRDTNGNWDDDAYEFNSKVSQLEDNLPKLYDLMKVNKNWENKYNTQLNKEQAPKIEVLWDFLTDWENKARDWYQKNAEYLVDTMNEFHKLAYDFLDKNNYFSMSYQEKGAFAKTKTFDEFFKSAPYYVQKRYGYGNIDVNDWVRSKHIDQLTLSLTNVRFKEVEEDTYYSYDQNFGYCASKGKYFMKSFDLEKLNKLLTQEKQAKYEDLCNRISDVVGEIQDVSNLSIGNQRGELNGIVKGSKGSARVETIGAGGYNVGEIVNVRQGQVFHYRVLVHKIR